MKILLTGADGFLGWHTRAAGCTRSTDHEVVPVGRDDWRRPRPSWSPASTRSCTSPGSTVAPTTSWSTATSRLAERRRRRAARGTAAPSASSSPTRSRPATARRTARARQQAADGPRAQRAEQAGGRFVDVRLPNLFGEHGRPATTPSSPPSSTRVVAGDAPEIVDRADRAAARPGRRPGARSTR